MSTDFNKLKEELDFNINQEIMDWKFGDVLNEYLKTCRMFVYRKKTWVN